jgi:hypothetical protein
LAPLTLYGHCRLAAFPALLKYGKFTKQGILFGMKALHAPPRFAIVVLATAVLATSVSASGQEAVNPQSPADAISSAAAAIPVPSASPAVQMLSGFRDSDVKFDFGLLMSLLQDRNHEGWVLAAYPDPKTGQPLIGAGVSIDLPAREHPQPDPLNPNQFIEPASADLWQAAGLSPERLNQILDGFHQNLDAWGDKREYRRHIGELPPQITGQEATQLLRIAIVQSILNARAYCRNFDRLTPWQQMALSQLVFQIGVNLQQFTQFIELVNSDSIAAPIAKKVASSDVAYWNSVQKSLIQSQWARTYRPRAISVIAMLDPRYNQNPRMAERRVGAVLRPAVAHRHRGRSASVAQVSSKSKSAGRHPGKKSGRARSKRKV